MANRLSSYSKAVKSNKWLAYFGLTIALLSVVGSSLLTNRFNQLYSKVEAYRAESAVISSYARYVASIDAVALLVLDETDNLERDYPLVLDVITSANSYDPEYARIPLDELISKQPNQEFLILPEEELRKYKGELIENINAYNALSDSQRDYYIRDVNDVGYIINKASGRKMNER